MPSGNNNLPRLGSPDAGKPSFKTETVAIPDRGATIVLRKPSVGMILDVQEELDSEDTSVRESYSATVSLVAEMLVEPKMSEDELRAEVDEWSFADWQILQGAALKLAGLREEDVRQARADFQGRN